MSSIPTPSTIPSPTPSSALRVTARWERPVLATGRGETHLVVRVAATRSVGAVRVPVDLALVIDRSGSMAFEKLELAKAGVRAALDLLRPEDRASLIAFDHEVETLAPLAHLDPIGRRALERALDRLEARGSTDLFGGWAAGCESLTDGRGRDRLPFSDDRAQASRLRRTLLLTDGQANVGTTDPGAIAHHAAQLRVRGITTSTLGVGAGFEEFLLAEMAEAGGGNFAYAEHAGSLPAFFARELGELVAIAALETRVRLTLPKGLRATLVSPFPTDREKKEVTVDVGALPVGMTVPLVFSVTGRFGRPCSTPPVGLSVDWAEPEGDRHRSVTVAVDPLEVVDPVVFARTPRHEGAGEQVAKTLAERAKRDAIAHYRAGRHDEARGVLGVARDHAMAAPMAAGDATVPELDALLAADPNAPAFEAVRRRTLNDAHRRARGREA